MTMRAVLKAGFVSMLLAAGLAAGPASASDATNPNARRIVSIGGTATEILYALGAGDRVIARDTTSSYPPEAMKKPDIGYMRALSPEGILGQSPDLILAEEGAGPPDAIAILKASAIPVSTLRTPPRADAIATKIRDVGAAVGLSDKAEALAEKTDADLKALAADVAKLPQPRKRVLFVLSLANGRIMAGGKDTEAAAIIGLAGGVNAADAISGYKPLTDEAVIAARPDVILVMQSGNHGVTPEAVFALPAFQSTPAAAEKALVRMDGLLLLGFGPRTPEAARSLAAHLYPGSL
ncbi:ABC transporter substrate-binding protein [Rhizobium sp. CSW-27]|uniref:heme/hemin ABC transporter substrate-binding protein n=1 Tax=Rhizobium sp. CSW-27 TaxID=2839985 RepID=UPI001C00E7C8|nr:ABC transporter substrate-binding protein [Rhizobium sp. CSW-27]MBT9369407.1 ABC transporter substrate-binding protein [Rhizobium sp. CSW-27]